MSSRQRIVPFRSGRERSPAKVVDLELEAQVIGAVLADNTLWRDSCFLEPDHFSDKTHAGLWDAISKLQLAGRPATPATVAVALGDAVEGMGGRDFLSALCGLGQMITPAFADAAERVRRLAQWRRLLALADEMQEWARTQTMSPDEALSAMLREIEAAIQSGRSTARTKREVVAAAIADVKAPRATTTTGIDNLDYIAHGGLMRKRLYAIGGPTGRGKTILAGSISDNLNTFGVRHLLISLETPPEDIEIRNCAKHLGLNAGQIYDRDDPLHERFLANADLYAAAIPENTLYEYRPGATIDEIQRIVIQAVHRFGIEGFILDYWQIIRGRERNQTEKDHLRDVANRLAAICRRENIWGVVLAQTDEHGRLEISDSLKTAAALYVRMHRDENDTVAHFVTEKSNYTRYSDTLGQSVPGTVFDLQGPHFRNLANTDVTALEQARDDALELD